MPLLRALSFDIFINWLLSVCFVSLFFYNHLLNWCSKLKTIEQPSDRPEPYLQWTLEARKQPERVRDLSFYDGGDCGRRSNPTKQLKLEYICAEPLKYVSSNEITFYFAIQLLNLCSIRVFTSIFQYRGSRCRIYWHVLGLGPKVQIHQCNCGPFDTTTYPILHIDYCPVFLIDNGHPVHDDSDLLRQLAHGVVVQQSSPGNG